MSPILEFLVVLWQQLKCGASTNFSTAGICPQRVLDLHIHAQVCVQLSNNQGWSNHQACLKRMRPMYSSDKVLNI